MVRSASPPIAPATIYIAEKTSHRVRKIAGSTTRTVAGRLHFAGDGGAAISAVLNLPVDVALDPQGIAAVIDSENFRVRRVAANGTINTIAGNGIPALPANGAQAAGSSVPKMSAATYDSQGNLYLAAADPSLVRQPDSAHRCRRRDYAICR
jgi:hypothetical protein